MGIVFSLEKAEKTDLEEILALQRLAYRQEARLVNNFSIQPLTQTLCEVEKEFSKGIILKAVSPSGQIIGSVRGYEKNGTLHIGKLIVHPKVQRNGIGTALLKEIEKMFPQRRYALFTGKKSEKNIRLYIRNGYSIIKEKEADGVSLVYFEKHHN